ncbi:MAG: response regulator [Candidatus Omnitrophota bacterium]|jgi:two-component system phosphate regulon response regulator PhoB
MSHKIMLVDDEIDCLRMMKLNLEAVGGYHVQVESRAVKALETARTFKPDLIFLDLVMPEMDGSDVACALKADPQLAKIPVVFLTATVTESEVSQTGQRIGGQVFLAKPVTVKQLTDCIQQILGE